MVQPNDAYHHTHSNNTRCLLHRKFVLKWLRLFHEDVGMRCKCLLAFGDIQHLLDFAQPQSRTESGTQIRDLVFYNNTSYEFLNDMKEKFGSRQLVVELKNVDEVTKEHINQLNRYLNPVFGSFGIIMTRNKPKKSVMQHTIDLWSGQRKCILIMDDSDLELMVNVYESKQRDPIEVIKMKYVDFTRKCPA